MPRVRKYTDKDVLAAAKERIEHIHDVFDTIVVLFSGGKDSSVVLHLVKEFREREGLGPVDVVFWDEEVMPLSNIKFIEQYRDAPWANFHWFCIPLMRDKYILGQIHAYIQWGEDRKSQWTRPMPEWAINTHTLGLKEGEFFGNGGKNTDDLLENMFNGSVALCNGVRASESLSRYRSCVNKLNENYICSIEGRGKSRLRICKPIYDWMENDVLKYLYDTGVGWCDLYEGQALSGSTLRVAPPLGVAAAKRFDQIREYDPEWYERLITNFPEMAVQDRYWQEFDQEALVRKYASEGFNGVLHYIEDWVQPGAYRNQCLQRYRYYRTMAEKRPEEFPSEHLLRMMINGRRDRKVRGLDTNTKSMRDKAKQA